MNKLIISSQDQTIVIQGPIDEMLMQNQKFHIKRKFAAVITSGKIVINDVEEKNVISSLSDYFSKNDICYEYSTKVSEQVQEQIDEERGFKEFSNRAKKIWDNDVDFEEFTGFQQVLKEKMVRRLYPLQLLSAYHLAFSQNAANFSVPGAGKTAIVYGAYTYLNNLDENSSIKYVDKILVVGPLSSFGPWKNEYVECFGIESDAKVISDKGLSTAQKKQYFFSERTATLTLISYQAVISQKDNIEFFLRNNKVMLVLDEAHKIKNVKQGRIAETILDLAPWSSSRVVLTGTPAPNGFQDLWNLFKFLWPKKQIIRHNLYQLEAMNKNENLGVTDLINDISPFFVRIKKKDLGLPPKREHNPFYVRMDKLHLEIYNIIAKKSIESFEQDINGDELLISQMKKARLIRMMQAASNPALLLKPIINEYGEVFDGEYMHSLDKEFVGKIKEYASTRYPQKFYKALDLIKELLRDGEKVIIWAIYVDTIKQFQKFLDTNGINAKILYGGTPIENEGTTSKNIETREKIINDFHDPKSGFQVIIANPFAVAESISLHKACHSAIYLEKNFDAARFVQSKDRIHRYGLSEGTLTDYYYIIGKESVEEVIHERLLEKEARMIRIMESKDIPLFASIQDEFDTDIRAVIDYYVNKNT
ncbi:DEAD/DEAH box helicase [Listeria booriae]|uniref:DEAD/DEAH box helicase family protein n=1 Tax=Listeria booriae TaxID=1552123 RepID=A0A7X1BW37_9LIST|nr:DEAD/DEAH box helicase [Listeria booriae]MBC1333429.1 DEAD/DEAH box helicase family protein [Listeria booriae]MBC2387388.1 DEAD/DEAH box helicase family protein [Listeria booriae]